MHITGGIVLDLEQLVNESDEADWRREYFDEKVFVRSKSVSVKLIIILVTHIAFQRKGV